MIGPQTSKARRVTLMGVLAAISIVVLLIIPFRVIFAGAPYLEYDLADVPILIGSFLLGPLAGLEILIVVSAIQAFFMGGNGIIGFIMHVCASGTLIIIASFIYHKLGRKTGSMIAGLVAGSIAMALVMIPLNLIFTVHFLGQPREFVVAALLPFIIPFNLIKAGINSAITVVVVKAVGFIFKRN